jgi:hypothetical protein
MVQAVNKKKALFLALGSFFLWEDGSGSGKRERL